MTPEQIRQLRWCVSEVGLNGILPASTIDELLDEVERLQNTLEFVKSEEQRGRAQRDHFLRETERLQAKLEADADSGADFERLTGENIRLRRELAELMQFSAKLHPLWGEHGEDVEATKLWWSTFNAVLSCEDTTAAAACFEANEAHGFTPKSYKGARS